MKKFLITLISFAAFGLMMHFSSRPKTKIVIDFETKDKKEVIKLEPAVEETVLAPEVNSTFYTRTPAQAAVLKNQIRLQQKFDTSILEFEYQLSSDKHIVKDIFAIPKKSYHLSMGPAVTSDSRFYFVHSEEDSAARPTVYDAASKQLLPLSYLIKVPEITDLIREELLSQGLKENLYMPHLGILYLEASKSDYVKTFESLKSQGYQPEYQLLERNQVGK